MSPDAQSLEHTERLLNLGSVEAFTGLPARQLAALAEYTEERYFRQGETLLVQGEPVSALHVVIEGAVRIERDGRVISRPRPRIGLGAMALYSGRPAHAAVVAEVDTLTLELRREPLMELLADNFAVLRHILRLMSRAVIDNRRALGRHAGYSARPSGDHAPEPSEELNLVERLLFLKRFFQLSTPSLNSIIDLARHATEVWCRRGEVLWRQGESGGDTCFLHSGTVRGEVDGGRQHFFFNANSPVGALDNTADRPRWYSALCETDVRLLKMPLEHLYDMLEDRFDMAREFLNIIATDLLEVVENRTREGAVADGALLELSEQRPAPV